MRKVFMISGNGEMGYCSRDCTPIYPTLEAAVKHFPIGTKLAEAPDYVFESWGFDPSKDGDERFIKPEVPEGWAYDDATGTFYPVDPDIIASAGLHPIEATP